MSGKSVFTDSARPEHLADKWRIFMLRFDDNSMMMLHVGRPVSFKTFCQNYIFQHLELIDKKDSKLFKTNGIVAIEKVPNQNRPDYEVTEAGQLIEIYNK